MYTRILLKLSGEQLQGEHTSGFDTTRATWIAQQVQRVVESGSQVVIMVGGGNYARGAQLADDKIQRITGDYVGMLATMMNALTLADVFNASGVATRALSNVKADQVIDQFTHQDPPAEPEQTTPPSESPSQTPTNSAPSPTNSAPSTSSDPSKAPSSEPPSSATPSAKPSSPSGGTTPSCWVREQRRSGQDGRLYPEDPNNDPEKKSIPCEEYEKYRNQGSDPFTPDSSATRLCTIVKEEQGQSPSTPVPVPCDEPR